PLLAVPRLMDDLLAVGLGQLALLELDGVGASLDGSVDELLRNAEIAVVVDSHFGDDVARLAGTDPARAEAQAARAIPRRQYESPPKRCRALAGRRRCRAAWRADRKCRTGFRAAAAVTARAPPATAAARRRTRREAKARGRRSDRSRRGR